MQGEKHSGCIPDFRNLVQLGVFSILMNIETIKYFPWWFCFLAHVLYRTTTKQSNFRSTNQLQASGHLKFKNTVTTMMVLVYNILLFEPSILLVRWVLVRVHRALVYTISDIYLSWEHLEHEVCNSFVHHEHTIPNFVKTWNYLQSMSQKIWTLSKNWTFLSIMMTMDIFSRFSPFQFRPRSKNIFDG